jgi:hypothetical protein
MKTIVIHEDTELSTLARRLAGAGSMKAFERLNPHLAAGRLKAGTVVLVPPDAAEGAQTGAAPHLQALAMQMKSALEAAVGASGHGLELRAGDRKQVADALRVPAMRRVIEADPDLRSRAAAVEVQHRKDAAQDKVTEQGLKRLQSAALAEIDALLKGLA